MFLVLALVVLVALLGLDAARTFYEGVPDITLPSIGLPARQPTATPRVYPSAAVVAVELRTRARLETATYTGGTAITAELNPESFLGLWTDRVIYKVTAVVVAGIDLQKLSEPSIDVEQSTGVVTIVLPEPEIFFVTVDEAESGVFDRQTGLFTKGDPTLEQQARQLGVAQIRQAAEEAGILLLAESHAQDFIRGLLLTLGFNEAIFLE
ncbi:DUF4230 domain-containing protein [candidate division WWE3 bacterium]|nr:DUF4230 domain-containing protein [candidate division WWE3 bacterium]